MTATTTAPCAYDDKAFWRVADTREGDLAAMGILAGAILSLLCALACAIRACALLRDRGEPRATHRCALPSSVRVHQQEENHIARAPHQGDDPYRDYTDGDGVDRARTVYTVDDDKDDAEQDHETGKGCDREMPAHKGVRSWKDKWKPALADPEGFAVARINARKEAHRATAATTHRRPRAQAYGRPLPLDVLVALERTAARVSTLPDPH